MFQCLQDYLYIIADMCVLCCIIHSGHRRKQIISNVHQLSWSSLIIQCSQKSLELGKSNFDITIFKKTFERSPDMLISTSVVIWEKREFVLENLRPGVYTTWPPGPTRLCGRGILRMFFAREGFPRLGGLSP